MKKYNLTYQFFDKEEQAQAFYVRLCGARHNFIDRIIKKQTRTEHEKLFRTDKE